MDYDNYIFKQVIIVKRIIINKLFTIVNISFLVLIVMMYKEFSGLAKELENQNLNSDEKILISAVEKDEVEIVTKYISKGFDVNKPVLFGETLLMIAALNGSNEVIYILLEAGADIDIRDDLVFRDSSHDGDTAFMYAVNGGHCDTVKLFLLLGIDINQQNRTGWTPLKKAVTKGHKEVVKLLLESGADVNKPRHLSPLIMAIWGDYLKITKLLIEAGADVNIRNNNHSTPLMTASFLGKKEIVRLLLEAGANPDLKDDKGRTAFDIAIEREHLDTAALIEKFNNKI